MLLDEDAIVADIRAHGYHIAEGAIPDELVHAHPPRRPPPHPGHPPPGSSPPSC